MWWLRCAVFKRIEPPNIRSHLQLQIKWARHVVFRQSNPMICGSVTFIGSCLYTYRYQPKCLGFVRGKGIGLKQDRLFESSPAGQVFELHRAQFKYQRSLFKRAEWSSCMHMSRAREERKIVWARLGYLLHGRKKKYYSSLARFRNEMSQRGQTIQEDQKSIPYIYPIK